MRIVLAQATPACIKETRTIQVKRGLWAPNFLSAVSMLRDVLSHRYEPMLLRKKGPHRGQSKKPRELRQRLKGSWNYGPSSWESSVLIN